MNKKGEKKRRNIKEGKRGDGVLGELLYAVKSSREERKGANFSEN